MVSVIDDSEADDQAKCLVRKFNNPHDKSTNDDKLECCVDKNLTVRQFINIVAQHYNLDFDSFTLTFSSFKSDSILDTGTNDKPKLEADDDRLLIDVGVIFGDGTQNRFVLSENEVEESDQAECIIRIPKDMKVFPLTVDQNETAGQLYKRVLELCQAEDINTEYFVLTFNSYNVNTELVKLMIREDDTRLLSDIGIVYREGVKNRFEISLNILSDNMDNDSSSKSCSPTQDQKIESQYSKIHPSIRRNGLDSSSVIENNVLEPTLPMLALPSTRMLYNRSTERAYTGYRGLVNQAMTCYLNSLLQALYMTPEFRNALYKWKFDFDANIDESKSIPFQLQRLFLNLQTSPRHSVETTELTRSFGWDSSEAWQQHDVQELCRVMFDALEQEFKNTTHVDLINQLYQGKMIDYVKCQECGIEKSREDTFLDIPLPIRPFGSTNAYGCIKEALKGFTQPETLDGNNQYFCERCNKKCNAHKGLKFSKFPYIMTLHLMRFDFDYNTMYRIKLNDKVVFPLKLNLNSFISNNKNGLDKEEALSEGFPEELFGSGSKYDDSSYTGTDSSSALDEIDQDEDEGIDLSQHRHEDKRGVDLNSENEPIGPYMYELYAIMIHSGSASGGHYYAYIKDFKTDQWLCFNDQSVSVITMDDIERSFGGGPIRGYYSGQYTSSTNAYMLMYRQIDHRRNKNAMTQEEFPPHLKELHNLLEKKAEEDRQMRERERDMYKVPVHLADFMECGVRSWQFDCSGTTTVEQLKAMAIEHFRVTKPCRLVIFNKQDQKVVENLEDKNNYLVCHLKYSLTFVLLLQMIDTEDNRSVVSTPGYVLMKLFMINLDDNEEDIDVSQPVEIEIELNKEIRDLSNLLYTKYDISRESVLHFAIQSSSKPTLLEESAPCSSIYTNYVFVFIERHAIEQSVLGHKMKNIITRYDNTILLQFIMPTKDTETLHKLMALYNKNYMNGYDDDVSMLPLEKQAGVLEVDCDQSNEDNNLVTNPEDMCVVAIGSGNGDQSEDSSITDSERTIKGDAIEDYHMDSPTFEHDPIKVYDQGRSEENWDGTEDDDDDNEFQSNEKYFFKTTKLSDKTSEDDDEKLYAYVDKRMTVKELKTQLVPYINIPSDFIILNRCKSETELEELALPSSSLEDLAYSDTIKITMGQALHDGEYRGIIYWIEPQEQTQILFKKMFDWIIKKGTSVLETKKELLVKLNNTHNIDIPLNRCRLRKKKRDSLMRCYFNEEIWNEDIGQGWEMVILDLKDRSELELNKTKRLMFVNHIEEATPRVISEMEFVVDIASTTSPNTQLGTEISKKLNIPEDQLEMGYMHGHSTEITWKTSVFNWSFSLSDDNIILYCRNADNTSNKETPSKWRRQRKERSLRIHTMNND